MRPEEWVIWGYRLFLGREPESSAVVRYYCDDDFSPQRLRSQLIASAEFRALGAIPTVEDPERAELRRLKGRFRIAGLTPREGFFTDFLGVRTRCEYLPATYAQYSGTIEHADGAGVVPLHEAAELIALLRSVEEGAGLFTVVELGAGWGPWLVAGAAAARQRDRPVRLVGVEGDSGHLAFMRTHMEDNGIDWTAGHVLLRAVVGAEDGMARFPVLPEPSADWGAKASFDPSDAGAGPKDFVEVPSIAIRTLLAQVDAVDLMHVDIQGDEADALEASAEAVGAKVRRLVIGTHGRMIEDRLFRLFAARNWTLEYEKACTFQDGSAGMVLRNDGVQVWRNPSVV